MDEPSRSADAGSREDEVPARIHRVVMVVLPTVMAIELAGLVYERLWLSAFALLVIMAVVLAPAVLGRRLGVRIPPELQVLVILFTFASLFLGEVRSYYDRFWWWDIALHTGSGLLLGLFGFLLVYVLNKSENVEIHMRPRFMAIFAFAFAVAVGGVWEIFEFTMDRVVGTRMQKPMLGDPSGLTDTMWDLIVDVLGALGISLFGWWYMRVGEPSFIERWIRRFIVRNPRLFRD